MKKSDEIELMRAIANDAESPAPKGFRRIIADSGINEKRAMYILEKYEAAGFIESGVSLISGWLVPEKINEMKKILAEGGK